MRSYGRPNYSRHGSVSFEKANRPEELSKLPRFYPTQDSHFNSVYGYSGYHSPQLFQSNPHHRLVQYTNSAAPNYLSHSPARTSPTHFNPKSNNFPQDVQVISKLDQFISPPANRQLTSPEVTPTPTGSRVRFTLADKLNMCTMTPTTTSNSSYWTPRLVTFDVIFFRMIFTCNLQSPSHSIRCDWKGMSSFSKFWLVYRSKHLSLMHEELCN